MRTSLSPTALLRSSVAGRLSELVANWQPVAVWVLWAVAVWKLAAFVARYGYNIPFSDEWDLVSVTFASAGDQLRWIVERHGEHRFPLGRAVYLVLLHLTGHDFRAGMFLSVGLLAGTAAVLVLVARRLRGRTVLADAAFPLLFLHAGHTENLLMGYQIVFTITVFALALFALVVAGAADATPGRSAVRGAACLVVVSQGGWLGLLFVPVIGAWVAWQAYRASGDRVRRWGAAVAIVAVIVYLGWTGHMLWELMNRRPPRAEALGLATRARSVVEVTGIGLGAGLGIMTPNRFITAGVLILVTQAVIGAYLFWAAVRRPGKRAAALGLMALLAGTGLFALSIGYSRESGLASRYTTFTAFGIAVALLALAHHARWSPWPVAGLAVAFGVFVFPGNTDHGVGSGKFFVAEFSRVADDAGTGMPLDVLAARQSHFYFAWRTRQGWIDLWQHDFWLVRGMPAPAPEVRPAVAASFVRDGEVVENHTAFDRYRVDLGGEREVSFVRVTFLSKAWTTWEPLVFEWTDPRTGERKRSVVKPWVRKTPDTQTTMFWIDGPLAAGELIMGREGCRFDVEAVEYGRIPRE